MKAILGGITIAKPEVTETLAAAKALSYPFLTMAGMRIKPSAATVAGPDPLTAPLSGSYTNLYIASQFALR